MRATQKSTSKRKIPEKRTRSPVIRARKIPEILEATDYRSGRSFPFLARACAAFLFIIFLLQPFSSVFAADEAAAGEESVSDTVESVSLEDTSKVVDDGPTEDSSEVAEEVMVVDEPAATEIQSDDEPVVVEPEVSADTEVTSDTAIPDSVATSISSESDPISDNEEVASSEEVVESTDDAATTEEIVPEEVPVAEEEIIPEIIPEGASEATSTEVVGGEAPVVATTTEEVTVLQPEVSDIISDSNRYQFGVDDCVVVEDGFFYCTKETATSTIPADRVYSAQDEDGDFEIFVSKDAVDTQITHNLYDDSAPQYDAESERLVWHALINDRYQIMAYDLKKNEMVQLTEASYNSMEPAVSGDRMVWQAWANGNWEIILEEDGERRQLTQNETHDIDPNLRGDLLSWQFLDGAEWKVKIYNIETEEVEILEGVDGSSVANPRLLLVYENRDENGDVRTVGFDLEKKISVPLFATPGAVPDEIPEPAHSKEEGAFVQPPPTLKEEVDTDIDTPTTTPEIGGEPPFEEEEDVLPVTPEEMSATSTISVVLDTEDETSASSTEAVLPEVPNTSHIEPVDLRPLPVAVSEAVVHIPDVVVPEFVDETVGEGALQ